MAYVLSSVSGNLISAASAGFAPTNSADVSAIASSYQVVSATSTQLYAGTAYVTSVNDAPLSAARAGNAANAALATSAWYDGTGRLISALPDEAAVSSIASSYAESAASGKQDTLTFDWNADSAISSINGSALAGGGAVTGDYVENSAVNTTYYYTANGVTAAAITSISGSSFVPKYLIPDTVQHLKNSNATFFYMPSSSPWGSSVTGIWSPLKYATGACLAMAQLNSYNAYYKGNEWYVSNPSTGMLRGEVHTSRGIHVSGSDAIGNYMFDVGVSGVSGKANARSWGLKFSGVSGVGTAESSYWSYGTAEYTQLTSVYDTVSANSASWGGGGIDSATCSAIASAYAESAVSSKADSSALSSYALSADVSGTISTVGTYSADWISAYSLISGVTALLDAI